MSYPAAAIRTAIKELLQGTIGTTRTVATGTFQYGVFDGQPLAAQQAKAIITSYTSRFDVKLSPLVNHSASPMSIKASYRIAQLGIEIPVWTTLKATNEETLRDSIRATIESNADVAIQALCYPGNLTSTSGAVATKLISGLLFGPGFTGPPTWETLSEDWTTHLHKGVIHATALITVTQATA